MHMGSQSKSAWFSEVVIWVLGKGVGRGRSGDSPCHWSNFLVGWRANSYKMAHICSSWYDDVNFLSFSNIICTVVKLLVFFLLHVSWLWESTQFVKDNALFVFPLSIPFSFVIRALRKRVVVIILPYFFSIYYKQSCFDICTIIVEPR